MAVIDEMGKYFARNPEAKTVDWDVLASTVRLTSKDGDVAPRIAMIEQARKCGSVSHEQALEVSKVLEERVYVGRIASLVMQYQGGEEIDFVSSAHDLTSKIRKSLHADEASLFEHPDVHDLIEQAESDVGFKFRQECLRAAVRALTTKLHVLFAAGVDSGKGSFLADMATFFAPQAVKLYPGRPILWLTNEGTSADIWPRVYSAALGKSTPEIRAMSREALQAAYAKAIGGNKHLIKVIDVHGWNMARVEGLVEELNPCVVMFDMLANFKVAAQMKTHEKMEYLAQEIRNMSVLADFLAVSTCQLSADGYDNLYPTMNQLKETKVGLQGALDLQINMGRLDDPSMQAIRGLSTPKNKRKRAGVNGYVRAEVIFDPDRARFRDS